MTLATAPVCAAAIVAACSSYEGSSSPDDAAPPPALDAFPDAPSDAGTDAADAAPSFHRTIHVAAGEAGVPAGYAVSALVDVDALAGAGKTRADFDDLHVTSVAGERDRVLDRPPRLPQAAIWFTLRAALAPGASEDYDLRYGPKAGGGAKHDGRQVFVIDEDGDAPPTYAPSAWTLQNAIVDDDAGVLTLTKDDTSGNHAFAVSKTTPPANAVIEIRAQVTAPTMIDNMVLGFEPAVSVVPWFVFGRGTTSATLRPLVSQPEACNQSCAGADISLDTLPHVYSVARQGTSVRFKRDGVEVFAAISTNPAALPALLVNASAGGNAALVTLVRVRPIADDEPTVVVGAEEPL